MSKETKRIALLGNPNVGKSSLFNCLTGLRQRVANVPGMTVEKRSGYMYAQKQRYEIVDLPGVYSLYARSKDEETVLHTLLHKSHKPFDAIIFVLSATQIEKGLLLLTQVQALGRPLLIALNMVDEAFKIGIRLEVEKLSEVLHTQIVSTHARAQKGVSLLQERLSALHHSSYSTHVPFFPSSIYTSSQTLQRQLALSTPYEAYLYLQYSDLLCSTIEEKNIVQTHVPLTQRSDSLSSSSVSLDQNVSSSLRKQMSFSSTLQSTEDPSFSAQVLDIQERRAYIQQYISPYLPQRLLRTPSRSYPLDRILMHPLYGTIVFLGVLGLIFQVLYAWSEPFMTGIEWIFSSTQVLIQRTFPQGALQQLLTEGILPGMSGVLVFIPQIAFLFLLIGLLEESGYMARVVALVDKRAKTLGLNGRSIVPLISGIACAVPAILAARAVQDRKARLITILITPLMSCSARLPVYTILIALLFPMQKSWGGLNVQGLVLLGLYVLGTVAALGKCLCT